MVGLLSVHDVGEGDEAEATHVGGVEGAVVGGGVFAVRVGVELFRPRGAGGFRDAGGGASDGYSGGLVRGGHDDFDVVWIKVAICDGNGGGVENGRDVVFCGDVRGDRGGGGQETFFLDVAFEDLRGGRGDDAGGGGAHAAGRGGEAVGLGGMLGGGSRAGDGWRWHC